MSISENRQVQAHKKLSITLTKMKNDNYQIRQEKFEEKYADQTLYFSLKQSSVPSLKFSAVGTMTLLPSSP
jgi:hypothetical protein